MLHTVLKNPGSRTLQNSNCMASYLSISQNIQVRQEKMSSIGGEVKDTLISDVPFEHMYTLVLSDQQKYTFISSVQTLDVV